MSFLRRTRSDPQHAGFITEIRAAVGSILMRVFGPIVQPKYAAQKAVDVILAAKVRLRVDDA